MTTMLEDLVSMQPCTSILLIGNFLKLLLIYYKLTITFLV